MDVNIKRSIVSIKLQVDYATKHGMTIEQCLTGSGLTEKDINNASYEIVPQQELAVIRNLSVFLQPNFFHALAIGHQYHLTSYGIWGFALTACKDIAESTQFALDHIDLTFAFCKISFQHENQQAFFSFDHSQISDDVKIFITIRDIVAFLNLHPEVLQKPLTPLKIELALDPGNIDLSPLEKMLNCKIEVNCKNNHVYFDPEILSAKLPQANALTAEICKAQCQELLIRRRQKLRISDRIESVLRTSIPMPNMDQVAQELHITSRTLHRQLKQDDNNWRQILEKVRSEICLEMIYRGEDNWSKISDRLGYSDTSNFIHAFKRWHNQTPSSFITTIKS